MVYIGQLSITLTRCNITHTHTCFRLSVSFLTCNLPLDGAGKTEEGDGISSAPGEDDGEKMKATATMRIPEHVIR